MTTTEQLVNNTMNARGQWTIPASMGACNALLEHSAKITLEILRASEESAIKRSKKDGYAPAITRADVEGAINATELIQN